MLGDELDGLNMDPRELYREEVFTDRKTGTLRRLTPVTSDGRDDPGRAKLYVGQTQLLTPYGTLPLSFEIEGRSLDEAVANFAAAAQVAVQHALEELKELRRESASSLIVPDMGPGGAGPGPGGKIQFR